MTVDCPFDCEYLVEARKHERSAPLDPETIPNRDIAITEDLLAENEGLVLFLSVSLTQATGSVPELTDADAREALDAAIRTYRTRESGLYYETVPENPLAARLARTLLESVEEFHALEKEELGMSHTKDSSILAVLVFLQHFALDRNNGRRKGRAFLHALREIQPSGSEGDSAGNSVVLA